FFDLQRLVPVHGSVEEINHMGAHKGLRDAISREVVGRDHVIGAGGEQVLLGIFFAGAGNDVELGVQAARGQNDVDVGGVGGGGGNQSAGALDVQLAQHLLLRGVAHHRKPAFVGVARQFGLVAVNNHKGQRLARQFARHAAAHPPGAADDVVVRQSADLTVHASPAEYRLQLEF